MKHDICRNTKTVISSLLLIFIYCLLLLIINCSNDIEKENLAKKYLISRIDSESQNVVEIVDFRKTNSVMRKIAGQKIYTFEGSAIIRIVKKCYKKSSLHTDYSLSKIKSLNEVYYPGAIIDLKFDVLLEKMEKGWRGKDYKINKAKVASNIPIAIAVLPILKEDVSFYSDYSEILKLINKSGAPFSILNYDKIVNESEKAFDVLIIISNKISNNDTCMNNIFTSFLSNSGSVILLTDGNIISFSSSKLPKVRFIENPINFSLKKYGIFIESNMVLDYSSCGQVSVKQKVGPFYMNIPINYPFLVASLSQNSAKKQYAELCPIDGVVLNWPSSILIKDSLESIRYIPLFETTPKSWTKTDIHTNMDPNQNWDELLKSISFKKSIVSLFAIGHFPKMNKSEKNCSLENNDRGKNREGALVVIAESDFVSDKSASPNNLDWFSNLLSFMLSR